MSIDDISKLNVRNARGEMIPIGTLVTITPETGPSLINLYNLYPAASVIGLPARGFSSGQAMTLMEQVAERSLPPGTGYEWTGMSYQEKIVGGQIYIAFGLGLLLVYLVLAGQYESWLAPFFRSCCRYRWRWLGQFSCSTPSVSTIISMFRSGSSC